MRYVVGSLMVLCWALLCGCASTPSPVAINSSPIGAKVVVKDANGDTIHEAVTPATLDLRPGNGSKPAKYTFEFTMDGYAPATSVLEAEAGGAVSGKWVIKDSVFGFLSTNLNAYVAKTTPKPTPKPEPKPEPEPVPVPKPEPEKEPAPAPVEVAEKAPEKVEPVEPESAPAEPEVDTSGLSANDQARLKNLDNLLARKRITQAKYDELKKLIVGSSN